MATKAEVNAAMAAYLAVAYGRYEGPHEDGIIAALEAAEQARWQDMETAPRDGAGRRCLWRRLRECDMAADVPRIIYWQGYPLEELSREELISAIHYLARERDEYLSPKATRARALGLAEMMRRGDPL